MNNKEAIEELKPLTKYSIDKNGVVGTFPMVWRPGQVEALDLAIKALEEQERPTLRHVIINHPRYGKSDAWYDEARQIVFQHWISKDLANTLGCKIEEAENELC